MNFSFTGMWERAFDSEAIKEMKARARVKFKGYKTKIVRDDGGIAIYVEDRYERDQYKVNLQKKIEGYEERKEKARLDFEAELERLAKEQDKYVKRFADLA